MCDSLEQLDDNARTNDLWTVVKIGHREHLECLADGALRFRHLAYYTKGENRNQSFFDENEGMEVLQPSLTEVKIGLPHGTEHVINEEFWRGFSIHIPDEPPNEGAF